MSTLNQPNRKAVMDAWTFVHTKVCNKLGYQVAPLYPVVQALIDAGVPQDIIDDVTLLYQDMLSASRGDQYPAVPTEVVTRSQATATKAGGAIDAAP